MSAFRSIASSSARRTAGSRKASWPGAQVQAGGEERRPRVPHQASSGRRGERLRVGRLEARDGIEIAPVPRRAQRGDVVVVAELELREVRDGHVGLRGRAVRRERIRGARRREVRPARVVRQRLDRGRGGQLGVTGDQEHQAERARPDRVLAERVIGDLVGRDAIEQVRGRDRLRRGLQEAAERRGEVQRDRRRIDRRRGDVAPGFTTGSRVRRVAQDSDRERNVIGRDRRAVLPELPGPQVEGPGAAALGDIPAGREVAGDRAVGAETNEAAEQEGDERALRGGPRAERARVGRPARGPPRRSGAYRRRRRGSARPSRPTIGATARARRSTGWRGRG